MDFKLIKWADKGCGSSGDVGGGWGGNSRYIFITIADVGRWMIYKKRDIYIEKEWKDM